MSEQRYRRGTRDPFELRCVSLPMPPRVLVLSLVLLSACAHGGRASDAEAPGGFDPSVPTGGIEAPGEESEVEPTADMEHVSFEEEPGPAERVQGAPKREPIPSFDLFGTRGEGPG